MKAEFLKKPIVNGSVNPSITLEEILANFDDKVFVDCAWTLAVKLDVRHNVKTISYDEVKASPRDSLLKIWDEHEQVISKQMQDLKATEMAEGKGYFEFVKSFTNRSRGSGRMAPVIPMSPNQILGYLAASEERWNYFEPSKIASSIRDIEKMKIRADYGTNNINTGEEITTYILSGGHLNVQFNVSENKQDEWLRKHEAAITVRLKSSNPYSVKVEKSKFEITFKAYWD
ncbi:hypothetical protein [Vibrio sp. D431a]|uniref:hypothetical protein n=1 Tax=Vibrio sp. D431a TaxID=2837388 RepID=UPI002554E894|nr:hypothetical protein [Vibrio sp. D431a]MDK9789768.1 hypothetical protein [Vibrio sp. D431a]